MKRHRVGILGATGTVGQRFAQLLEGHPQLEITALAASDRSAGKPYSEACAWKLHGSIPENVRDIVVQPIEPPLDCDLVFSSLPSNIARETEEAFARAGYPVISNSSSYRMDEDVPLLIAEINADHVGLIEKQKENRGFTKGFIVTNPNCAVISFAPPLAALHKKFGVESCVVTTLQAISGGRALVNIVTGGDPVEQQKYGDFLDHDERYARTAEFLEVFRACWNRDGFSYEGRHFRVNGGGLNNGGDTQQPLVYFGGASPAAEAVAARLVDVYLLWGEPQEWVRERIDRMRTLAAEEGRMLRFGIRLHVITRANEADAWAEADRLLSTMSKEDIENAQANFARTQSVGQQRMTALHGGKADSLVVAPNLWAGIGLVRGGAGTALVGSHDQVAERIREYAALGIDTFILSGYPHLEECYVVGEELLPLLR